MKMTRAADVSFGHAAEALRTTAANGEANERESDFKSDPFGKRLGLECP